jgi:lipopolysaccharide biosynthesis protein
MHSEPINKPSLCIFIHFSEKENYPHYVQIYVNELCRFFDEVILVSNERQADPYPAHLDPKVKPMFVKNEGYDLGMFYKAWKTIDPSSYSRIACINDSNILLKPLDEVFDWASGQSVDFWGLLESWDRPWFSTHQDDYHLQSHFLVLETPAIERLGHYFQQLNMNAFFAETALKKVRRMVINSWEIGLTQYLKQEGLSIGSFIEAKEFSRKHMVKQTLNLSHKKPVELLKEGYPLLKKRLINPKKRFSDIFKKSPTPWQEIVRQYGHPQFDLPRIIADFT